MTGIAERVLQSSVRAEARTIDSVFQNLVEEVGELSRALNRPWRCDEPAICEIADVINCAIDLAFMLEMKDAVNPDQEDRMDRAALAQRRLEYFVDKKCDKWDRGENSDPGAK